MDDANASRGWNFDHLAVLIEVSLGRPPDVLAFSIEMPVESSTVCTGRRHIGDVMYLGRPVTRILRVDQKWSASKGPEVLN